MGHGVKEDRHWLRTVDSVQAMSAGTVKPDAPATHFYKHTNTHTHTHTHTHTQAPKAGCHGNSSGQRADNSANAGAV